MICPYCNAEIRNDSEQCRFCGAEMAVQKENTVSSGENQSASACGQPVISENAKSEIGMKWFKFLIYFVLFADAAMKAFNGISNLTGGISRGEMYADYSILKPIDIIFGIFSFVLAACCIFTRFQLAEFKKNSYKMFYVLQIIQILSVYAYEAAYLIVAGINMSTVKDIVISISVTAVYIILNAIYFDRRRHLFIN